MVALRIGLLVVDGITLAEVVPARERLEQLGMQVVLLVPDGGSILPVTGRYYPAAGGQGVRRSLSQVSPDDFDLLLVSTGLSDEQLIRYPQALAFVRGYSADGGQSPVIIFSTSYLLHLLEHGVRLDGLLTAREGVLSR